MRTILFNNLSILYNSYRVSTEQTQKHQFRSEILQCVATSFHARRPTIQPHLPDDLYLIHAENVIYKGYYSHAPASYARIQPKAESYVAEWRAFKQFLATGIDTQLETKIDNLVRAHLSFMAQAIKEIKIVAPYSQTTALINNPKTIIFFEHISQKHANIVQEPLHNLDPILFDLVPFLSIYELLIESPVDYPEIFKPLQDEIHNLRLIFLSLSQEQQEQLLARSRSLTEDQPTVVMEPIVHTLFKEMSTLATSFRANSATNQTLNSCIQAFCNRMT